MVHGWVRSAPRVGSCALSLCHFYKRPRWLYKATDNVNKFADDTKLKQRIESDQDRETLQRCIDNLLIWAEDWCMEFNVKKCKVMHVGMKNPNCEYIIAGTVLQTVSKERDIGVVVNQDLKPSLQCAESSRRASTVLGQITRTFLYRDRFTFLRLYTQFVRCHLEFAVPAWSPWTGQDIKILEKVQRRAVNLIIWGKAWWNRFTVTEGQTNQTRPDPNVHNFEGNRQSIDHNTWFSKVVVNQTYNISQQSDIKKIKIRCQAKLFLK